MPDAGETGTRIWEDDEKVIEIPLRQLSREKTIPAREYMNARVGWRRSQPQE